MKTVILNGSPRKQGDTSTLLAAVSAVLQGEILKIDAFEKNIFPCTDCRHCKTHGVCCKADKMQELYEELADCDNIIIASPIWMETLPPPLLSIASRLQPYFYRPNEARPKKGGILLVGGGSGGAKSAERTARLMLRQLNVTEVYPLILSGETDTVPAINDTDSLRFAETLAKWMNT